IGLKRSIPFVSSVALPRNSDLSYSDRRIPLRCPDMPRGLFSPRQKTASIDGRTDRRPTQEELRKPIRPRHLRRCDLTCLRCPPSNDADAQRARHRGGPDPPLKADHQGPCETDYGGAMAPCPPRVCHIEPALSAKNGPGPDKVTVWLPIVSGWRRGFACQLNGLSDFCRILR